MSSRLFISGLETLSAAGWYRTTGPTYGKYTTTYGSSDAGRESWTGAVPSFGGLPVYKISEGFEGEIDAVCDPATDRVTKLAVLLSRGVVDRVVKRHGVDRIGVSVGSARGATGAIERAYDVFAQRARGLPARTSPMTTAGGISAAVAQQLFLRSEGESVGDTKESRPVALNTSMTCTSAFHSLLSGVAFIRSRMCSTWIFGGSEAPLTPFTLAQMEALKIYSRIPGRMPCRPLAADVSHGSTFALGEGSGLAILHSDPTLVELVDLELLGIGWSLESTPSMTGVSEDGIAFESAMRMALASNPQLKIDLVVPHSTGTIKGDAAEVSALERVFAGAGIPPVASSKPYTGHLFGACGMLSLEVAHRVLTSFNHLAFGYDLRDPLIDAGTSRGDTPKVALINAAGFGGNVISLLVGSIDPEMSK